MRKHFFASFILNNHESFDCIPEVIRCAGGSRSFASRPLAGGTAAGGDFASGDQLAQLDRARFNDP